MSGVAPQLVYIAAMSRSGSTLLDLLLDQHPAIASLGELHVLPHEAHGAYGSLPCGCGQPVTMCPVWSVVLATTDPLRAAPPRLHHFRETHQWGPTVRWSHLRDRWKGHDRADDAMQYLRNTTEVVTAAADAITAVTGDTPQVLVDASKDPYRMHWLMTAKGSDVRVIHLTRDPRAVVNSLTREQTGAARVKTVARRSAAWVLENALMANSLKSLAPQRQMRIRYEDLAADPDRVLASIHTWLGLPAVALDVVATGRSHALAGNPMRRSPMKNVSLDERWRSELPGWAQAAVRMATRPLQRRLGDLHV